ncbi:IclR family transcriptional regulator [Nocardia shimofusensis]|uniref:IclR family transcriptional regulator n=1 Tax=Nocardia shimofusensis TaxID=228596 RepID=UPI0008366645|nr:IclR family transcriptional regulator [Nocardia shimofusensis]
MSTSQLDDRSVLGRVVHILEAFAPDDRAVGLSELARRTGLPKTTVHRVCRDLVTARWLTASPQGYRLGRGLFELGMRAAAERTLLEVAVPFMQDLYTRTQETVHLGVLDGDEVVYISKIGGHRQARAPSRVGGRMPLYCTAIGKALLAHAEPRTIERVLAGPLPRLTPRTVTGPGLLRAQLDRIVEQGVAYEYEESTTGIVCVAAAVLDAEDHPLAAISMTGPTTRFRPEAHAVSVRAAAAAMASILARRGVATP